MTIPRVTVGSLSVPRIICGCWQVAGGHGKIDHAAFVKDMKEYADAGFTAFDTADIYGPSEGVVGKFLKSQQGGSNPIVVTTKFCRGFSGMSLEDLRAALGRSCTALGVQSLDLVALHWWDFEDGADVSVGLHLRTLREEGLLKNIGVTNYDVGHLKLLVEAGVPVVSNQVQLSLLDRRPIDSGLAAYCSAQGIALFTYGSVGGGFLSERWLGMPAPAGREDLNTTSLHMYYRSISAFGSWQLFQELLSKLSVVAEKHSVSMANVAVRWVLQQPAVAAAIIGMRNANNLADNTRAFSFELDESDMSLIASVLTQAKPSEGDVYARERLH